MNLKQVDYKLFFAVFCLIIFGMIMISSVSVYPSFRVTSMLVSSGLESEAYNYYYLYRNIIHVIISIFALLFIVKIPYSFFEKYAKLFLGIGFLGLLAVLFIGEDWNGAKGWINLPFLPFAIQPTEFMKLFLIIFWGYFLKENQKNIRSLEKGFIPFIAILGAVILLIGMQPDFGSIMVIAPLSVLMFFIAGANVRYLFILFFLGLFLFVGVYQAGKYDKTDIETRNKLSYITDRIDNFLSNKQEAIKNKTINYQTEQALIAIGSGGVSGVGFGNSIQKFGYLPEVQGDFIFSVIVEELGFFGGLGLILIYLYIGFRGFLISYFSTDLFARFVAFGISSWILLQAFINIGVNLNIIPLTGITMPFVSYGGSSLLALICGIGVLLGISRHIDYSNSKKRTTTSFDTRNLFIINR